MTEFTARNRAVGRRVRSAAEAHLANEGGDDEAIAVTSPFTDEEIGRVPAGDADDVGVAFRQAREARPAWADRPVAERAAVLLEFAGLVVDHREELLDVIQRETGKARTDAIEEVLDVVATAQYYGHEAEDHLTARRRSGGVPLVTRATERYPPVGVVGMVCPWNYPLVLTVSDALPALVAGNAVVMKPAEETPFTLLVAADLLAEAGLDPGLFRVVTGEGAPTGPPVVDEADYVTFTGSTAVGREIAERAGRTLTDCSLELGGKNPMVVLDDADPDRAAGGAVRGSFANAGQLCLSMERIYVHEAVYGDFLDRFVERTRNLELGAGIGYGPDVGSLVSGDQLSKVNEHVEDARQRGGTVEVGGRHRPDVGPYFYEPTVLTDLPDDALAATEETFGPVVSVEPVASTDEAVERANDSEYGLNASVFAGDADRGAAVAARIDCGTVNVNDGYIAAWSAIDAPMGGTNDSGIGRRHGRQGVRRFTEPQTVAVQRGPPLAKPDWLPGELYERGLTAVIAALERFGRFG